MCKVLSQENSGADSAEVLRIPELEDHLRFDLLNHRGKKNKEVYVFIVGYVRILTH